jgi:hypothetical protein
VLSLSSGTESACLFNKCSESVLWSKEKAIHLLEEKNIFNVSVVIAFTTKRKCCVQEGHMCEQDTGSDLWNERKYFTAWAVWKGRICLLSFLLTNFTWCSYYVVYTFWLTEIQITILHLLLTQYDIKVAKSKQKLKTKIYKAVCVRQVYLISSTN